MRVTPLALTMALALKAAPAAADAGPVMLVNGTDGHITSVSVRLTGTQSWRPLAYAAAPGGRAVVPFSGPDCAYDIRANVGSATLV